MNGRCKHQHTRDQHSASYGQVEADGLEGCHGDGGGVSELVGGRSFCSVAALREVVGMSVPIGSVGRLVTEEVSKRGRR